MARHDVTVDGRTIGNVQGDALGWDGETVHGVHVVADAKGALFPTQAEATAAVIRQWREAEDAPGVVAEGIS